MGIGEATPVTNFAFLCFRLPPQSFLPVGIGEATPVGIWVGDARDISSVVALYVLPGNASGVTFTSSLALILALVNA